MATKKYILNYAEPIGDRQARQIGVDFMRFVRDAENICFVLSGATLLSITVINEDGRIEMIKPKKEEEQELPESNVQAIPDLCTVSYNGQSVTFELTPEQSQIMKSGEFRFLDLSRNQGNVRVSGRVDEK